MNEANNLLAGSGAETQAKLIDFTNECMEYIKMLSYALALTQFEFERNPLNVPLVKVQALAEQRDKVGAMYSSIKPYIENRTPLKKKIYQNYKKHQED
jgi:hypothetical protein